MKRDSIEACARCRQPMYSDMPKLPAGLLDILPYTYIFHVSRQNLIILSPRVPTKMQTGNISERKRRSEKKIKRKCTII